MASRSIWAVVFLAAECLAQTPEAVLRTPVAEFHVLPSGHVAGVLLQNGHKLSLDDRTGDSGDLLRIDGQAAPVAPYDIRTARRSTFIDKGIRGERIELRAAISLGPGETLEKSLILETRQNLPNLVAIAISLTNTGRRELRIDRIEFGRHRFNAAQVEPSARPFDVWTFQGTSRKWGEGEITPVDAGFERANLMGAMQGPEGEGGGLPVVAFWTRRMGVATGHLDPLPRLLSLPVRVAGDGRIETSTVIEPSVRLKPGQAYRTPRGFLAVYHGDYYEALSAYAKAVPIRPMKAGPEAYRVAWCGWGYGFGVTPAMMLGTIPKLEQYHLHWATLDDGWFETYGDWNPRPTTFPGRSIQDMVADFHRRGIKVQIWWYPLAAEDGVGRYTSHEYRVSQVVKEHPDWLILDKNGKHARFSRDLAVLCPALPEVQEYYKRLTGKFLRDWDFDGHKLDVVYSVPACYNPKHHHRRPEESIEAVGKVYRQIYETSLALKPESVTQICPCGTTPNIGWLPFENQAVAADPHGSVQVRERIKMYKALLGPRAAVTGDHVEYTGQDFSGTDFASTIGLGGIPSSRFTWPDGGRNRNYLLDDDKSRIFQRWFELYESTMLSTGVFRNLYIHGYDIPDGYAVAKNGKMYYAFFAPEVVRWQTSGRWQGEIELRGLGPGRYRVVDYTRNMELGFVDGRRPTLRVDFEKHLLLEVEKTGL
jgi:alpha-galactosidase